MSKDHQKAVGTEAAAGAAGAVSKVDVVKMLGATVPKDGNGDGKRVL
jgi:hypothetical protein